MHELPLARYRSLDFWRGVACLSVIVFHSTFYAAAARPSGLEGKLIRLTTYLWAGVPIFFVISGFCISAAADGQRRKGHSIKRYFVRRFRRIYPPFWAALAVAIVVATAVEHFWPHFYADDNHPIANPLLFSPLQWVGNITLTESWRAQVVGEPRQYAGVPLWTLCYEEQFYAIVGVALVISRRYFGWILAAVTAVVALLPERWQIDGFFFDGRWFQFAIGCAVYWAINYGKRLGWLAVLSGLVACAALSPPLEAFWFASMFGIALLVMARIDTPFSEAGVTQPISRCGLMCYSLYLVHWPVCKAISHGLWCAGLTAPRETLFITVPLCMAASLVAGAACFRFVERRFMN